MPHCSDSSIVNEISQGVQTELCVNVFAVERVEFIQRQLVNNDQKDLAVKHNSITSNLYEEYISTEG